MTLAVQGTGGPPSTGGGTTPVEVSVVQSVTVSDRGTRFDVLRLESVDAGASVVAKCRREGRRCRGTARRTLRLGAGSGTVDLGPLTKVTFKPRTVITIKVTVPGAVGAARIITVRRTHDQSLRGAERRRGALLNRPCPPVAAIPRRSGRPAARARA